MLIKTKTSLDVSSPDITPKSLFVNRRRFLQSAAAIGAGASLTSLSSANADAAQTLPGVVKSAFSTDEDATPKKHVTTYNNFYEFGTGKDDPAKRAGDFKASPWTVVVDGEVAKPGKYDMEDLIRDHALEERIYRLRCVEAWSMVVPWVGVPLAAIIKRLEPTSKAKYVAFETLVDPEQMPGQRFGFLDWPYVEGLTINEATNPLTLLAVGVYGEKMPTQNGAPIRLVVPWKYGFKSIKSIVRISFVETMPPTTWNKSASREYGFYANVNPTVDHPRWSQAKERRIGDFLKRKTLMFNGYGEYVAHLYSGMDLEKYY